MDRADYLQPSAATSPPIILARSRARAAEEEILQYERKVDDALRAMARRHHREIVFIDSAAMVEDLGEDDETTEWAQRCEATRRLFAYATSDGIEPWQVLRRLAALGFHLLLDPFCQIEGRERAFLLGDDEASRSWRVRCIAQKAPGQRKDVAEFERRALAALRRSAARHHYEPPSSEVSLSEILQSEEGTLSDWGARHDTIRRLFSFMSSDGSSPRDVVRKFYVIGAHMMIEPFCFFTVRDRGELLGDSHGAQHWLMRRACGNPLMRSGAYALMAPGEKSAAAKAVASRVQIGNTNRRLGRQRQTEL